MIIKDINKKIKNTPDNINEELAPISEEYIRGLFKDLSGDDSNPLDSYTKSQIDTKIQGINSSISTVSSKVSNVESSMNSNFDIVRGDISSSNKKIVALEGRVSTMKNITYSTSEPTSEQGVDGDLWIIYEE